MEMGDFLDEAECWPETVIDPHMEELRRIAETEGLWPTTIDSDQSVNICVLAMPLEPHNDVAGRILQRLVSDRSCPAGVVQTTTLGHTVVLISRSC